MAEVVTRTDDSAVRVRKKGKGLGWSDEENLALCVAESAVSENAARGSSMTAAAYGRRIHAEFVRARPTHACTAERTSCPMDTRRWTGRSAQTAQKQWGKVKAACVLFATIMKRLENMDLTGGPTKEDLLRIATCMYNDKVKRRSTTAMATSQIYAIIQTPNYRIGDSFPYKNCYDHLRAVDSLILDAGGLYEEHGTTDEEECGLSPQPHNEADGIAEVGGRAPSSAADTPCATPSSSKNTRVRRARPEGTRSAKKARRDALSGKKKAVEVEDCAVSSLQAVAASSARFSDVYADVQERKTSLASRELALKEKQLEFDKMKSLLSVQGSLPAAQQAELFERLFASLGPSAPKELNDEEEFIDVTLAPTAPASKKLVGLFDDEISEDDVVEHD